jgi:hypothetical protein
MRPADPSSDIPLDLSDLLTVCREYTKLGLNLQHQVEILIEYGVDTAINQRLVSRSALPHIRAFLKVIGSSWVFGDSSLQASDLIDAIDCYQHQHPYQPLTN